MKNCADRGGDFICRGLFISIFPQGVLSGILGGGMSPGSSNLDFILDQKLSFSTPVTLPPKSVPVMNYLSQACKDFMLTIGLKKTNIMGQRYAVTTSHHHQ